jgi:hypothetical protein
MQSRHVTTETAKLVAPFGFEAARGLFGMAPLASVQLALEPTLRFGFESCGAFSEIRDL